MPLFLFMLLCPGGFKSEISTLGKVCLNTLAPGNVERGELAPSLAGLTLLIHTKQMAGGTKSQHTESTSPKQAVEQWH